MFKITITETKMEKRQLGHEWERVDASDKSEYAYTPYYEGEKEISREVYSQVCETLDLAGVICAVNEITEA